MLVLRRRNGAISMPTPSTVDTCFEELRAALKSLVYPVRELQATSLGVDTASLEWADRRPDLYPRRRSVGGKWVEIFILDAGLLVVNARGPVRRSVANVGAYEIVAGGGNLTVSASAITSSC